MQWGGGGGPSPPYRSEGGRAGPLAIDSVLEKYSNSVLRSRQDIGGYWYSPVFINHYRSAINISLSLTHPVCARESGGLRESLSALITAHSDAYFVSNNFILVKEREGRIQ